jgi:hypothetical protein
MFQIILQTYTDFNIVLLQVVQSSLLAVADQNFQDVQTFQVCSTIKISNLHTFKGQENVPRQPPGQQNIPGQPPNQQNIPGQPPNQPNVSEIPGQPPRPGI